MSARQACMATCSKKPARGLPPGPTVPLLVLLATVAGCTASVTSVTPPSVAANGPAFQLTVLGSGFAQGSTVQWNGADRSTTYVSATELVAQINAADIATTGSASVTVTNPAVSSNESSTQSNAKAISIVPPSIDATTYRIDPAHDGVVTFASMSFPSAPTWSVNVGTGTPSNIVIADGKVFLTTVGSSGSQVLALSQTHGAPAWGPVAIADIAGGSAGAAYDNGRLFVAEGGVGTSTLYAYDANTGALDWSTGLAAGPTGPPTAADGFVYVIVPGSGTLYALDEGTGAITWQRPMSAAGGTPAVTADGVYVTAATSGCSTIDLRPATGEVIWDSSGGIGSCQRSDDATAAVANQLVYAPASSGTSIFSSEAGTGSGTLSDSAAAAFTSSTAYFQGSPNLDAVNLSSNTVQWTFNGDNELETSPIVVNQYVITGSSLGNLYAVDATSGSAAWTRSLGAKIVELAAGDGLLVALAETDSDSGGTLTAYTLSTSPLATGSAAPRLP
jgi:outer membrane protein assembly factor BamB